MRTLTDKQMQRIFEKYKEVFEQLEHYDRTREKLWEKNKKTKSN